MKRSTGVRLMAAPLAVAIISGIDLAFWWNYPSTPVAAVMDEVAHALTALLFLGAIGAAHARPTVVAALVGGVLIDVDHVPLQVLGSDILTRGTIRPYPHSLATLIACAAAWLVAGPRWRSPLAGLGFGVATHLIRDMASVGVPLFWPATAATATVPAWVYPALLLTSAAAIVRRRSESICCWHRQTARARDPDRHGHQGVQPQA